MHFRATTPFAGKTPTLVECGEDGNVIREISLCELPCYLIGRSVETCEIFLDSPSISRQHVAIVNDGNDVVVIDLSSNGTVLGDERIQKDQFVVWSDQTKVLRLGNCTDRTYRILSAPRNPQNLVVLRARSKNRGGSGNCENRLSSMGAVSTILAVEKQKHVVVGPSTKPSETTGRKSILATPVCNLSLHIFASSTNTAPRCSNKAMPTCTILLRRLLPHFRVCQA